MSWAKREATTTNLVSLGDGEGDRRKVGGLLVATPKDRLYPQKTNYELVQKDGEVLTLSGSASLSRQINEQDIGKFIKCEFTGWDKSPNGKYKVIEVNVWEGEPSDDMKAWPRYAEFRNNGKKAAQTAPADDFGTSALKDDDDDLPF